VPGVLWAPVDVTGPLPVVLLGHGGGQHKKAPGVVARARRFVANCGFAAAAIDAPGHGDRPRTSQDEQVSAYIKESIAAGQAVGPEIVRYNAERAVRAVPERHTILDALQELALIGTRSHVGYWGISLGSAIGVPYTASEPRVDAAVFGLAGHEAWLRRRRESPSPSSSSCSGTTK
jgi:pimeloyl-ACP methyl ester carboxylesterase